MISNLAKHVSNDFINLTLAPLDIEQLASKKKKPDDQAVNIAKYYLQYLL
jgi:hypothetical protein